MNPDPEQAEGGDKKRPGVDHDRRARREYGDGNSANRWAGRELSEWAQGSLKPVRGEDLVVWNEMGYERRVRGDEERFPATDDEPGDGQVPELNLTAE